MSESRKPEFIFQAYRKNPEENGKPLHLSSFELFPARLWKRNPVVTRLYGPYTPLPGLFRLRVDQRWYKFHPEYMFLTFHEVWRVIGSMASEAIELPVKWEDAPPCLNRGDRVRVMGADGFIKTIVLSSGLDEMGVEWISVQGMDGIIPTNAVTPVGNLNRSNATTFHKALAALKRGMTLWHWPEVPDRKPPLPEQWEVISCDLSEQRGLDPKMSTIVALQLGGMDMREAEDFYAQNVA